VTLDRRCKLAGQNILMHYVCTSGHACISSKKPSHVWAGKSSKMGW